MRALLSLILGSLMINLSAHAKSSVTSSDNSTGNQNMEEEQDIQNKNPLPQKMEDAYSGRYPKRLFKGYDKYHKTRLPDSTPQEILQTED